uniref:Uncharacterized protein n=1 Tax=Anguilla anguilla TaxID=7936 RepID=A0A0E9XTG6_ANGAN
MKAKSNEGILRTPVPQCNGGGTLISSDLTLSHELVGALRELQANASLNTFSSLFSFLLKLAELAELCL